MSDTPYIPSTSGKFQKVITQLQDSSGIDTNLESNTEGSLTKLNVTDNNQEQLLTEILKQLKIMNLHLSILTDNQINNTEVE